MCWELFKDITVVNFVNKTHKNCLIIHDMHD